MCFAVRDVGSVVRTIPQTVASSASTCISAGVSDRTEEGEEEKVKEA